jgi:alkylation response protein AidB-like acyl-CoA dehydrogenase
VRKGQSPGSGVDVKREIFEDEHGWFRESVQAFVQREILPVRDQMRADRQIPRDVWLKAGQSGFLGLGVPSEFGGAGVSDFRFNAVLGEELARAGMAFASSFTIHTDVVAPYLVDLTTEEQRERWLPRFCTGEAITAIGMTEPEAGSDLAALRTTASQQDDGWLINGSKTFITNGFGADLVVVAARTTAGAGSRGISLFVVEDGMDGFTRGRKLHKVGQHEADTAELFFEDVHVPADNLIGELDGGFGLMMHNLAQERISAAIANLAHATGALEVTLEYSRERRAFGRPIGTFQHNRFTIASASTEVDVTQAYLDRCIAAHVAGELTAIDAAKAKWWSAEVQNRVIDACVQLFGGYGYMEEYDVARAWCDARVTKIWAGSNEIMKEIIGRSLGLGDPRAAPDREAPSPARS